jgi:hypothetical protein
MPEYNREGKYISVDAETNFQDEMEFWTVFYILYFPWCLCIRAGRGGEERGNEAELKRGYMQRPPSKEKAGGQTKRPGGKGWRLFSWKSKRPLIDPSSPASSFAFIHSLSNASSFSSPFPSYLCL